MNENGELLQERSLINVHQFNLIYPKSAVVLVSQTQMIIILLQVGSASDEEPDVTPIQEIVS